MGSLLVSTPDRKPVTKALISRVYGYPENIFKKPRQITRQRDLKLLILIQHRQHPWRRVPSRRHSLSAGPEIPSSGPLLFCPQFLPLQNPTAAHRRGADTPVGAALPTASFDRCFFMYLEQSILFPQRAERPYIRHRERYRFRVVVRMARTTVDPTVLHA